MKRNNLQLLVLLIILQVFHFGCQKEEQQNGQALLDEAHTYYLIATKSKDTKEAISNCEIIMVTMTYPALHSYDTLGKTDSRGIFGFEFMGNPSNKVQAYRDYWLLFNHTEFEYDLRSNYKLQKNYSNNSFYVELERK